MASPFRIFRKHQKIMIATLGLLAMIAFVFLPMLMKQRGTRSVRNPVIVKTSKFGNLRAYELDVLRDRRLKVRYFLERVQRALRETEGSRAAAALQIQDAIGPATEEALVDTWLCTEYAEELGLVVSNKAINQFIGEVTENRLDVEELGQIFEAVKVNQYQLFEFLRYELMALRFRWMFRVSLAGTPPAQRWDYYTRLKRKAAIEAAPVAVEKFIDQVEDPDEKTLRAFFEQYKESFADPVSPEPGFHEPKRVAVRYFKADYEQFGSKDAVSDEEVQEFFDRFKERFDQESTGTDDRPTDEKPAAEEPTAEEPPTDPPAEEESPAAAEEPKPAEESGPPKEQPSDTEPAENEPENKDDTSFNRAASPFALVSFLQEEEPAAEGAAEASQPSEAGQPSPELISPAPQIPDPVPGAEPAPPEMPALVPPKRTPEEAAEPEDPFQPKAPKDPLAGPLGEAIRLQLAGEKADEKIRDVFTQLREAIGRYRSKLALYEAQKASGKAVDPPVEPDYDALAKQYGLTTGQTPLISHVQALERDIGRSRVEGGEMFTTAAYRDDWGKHLAATSRDAEDNQYLFWKVDEIEAKVPKFEDEGVRKQVLQEWKKVQARALATQEAQRLAEEARKAGTTLKQSLANRPEFEVIETPPFSWMTRGYVPDMSLPRPMPRLSRVEGIEYAGPDFMRAVFALQQGEVGVAMNHPQSIAYVVRVTEVQPPLDSLWAQFEVDPYMMYYDVATPDLARAQFAWMEALKSQAGLEWVEKPRRPAPR